EYPQPWVSHGPCRQARGAEQAAGVGFLHGRRRNRSRGDQEWPDHSWSAAADQSRECRSVRFLRRVLGLTDYRQPSWITSKSLAVRLRKAGFSSSLFQRESIAPLMYMSQPLSATIRPCLSIARNILRM